MASSPLLPIQVSIPVHLYTPNLICYVRLGLVTVAWARATLASGGETLALIIFIISIALDGVDGAAARRFNQVSSFGAWLDVWVDNTTRGILWQLGLPGPLGLLPSILEMTTFLATHKGGGAAWKEGCFRDAPGWIIWLMAQGFKTPQGAFIVCGLFGAPLWLWACRWLPADSPWSAVWLGAVLIAGRCTAAMVEVWIICRHLAGLLSEDDRTRRQAVRDAAKSR